MDFKTIGVQRGIRRERRDRLVGHNLAVGGVDDGFIEVHLEAGRRSDDDVVVEIENTGLTIVQAVLRRQEDRALVLGLDLGANFLQFDHVRLGDVLRGRLGVELVPALVARVAAELRPLHGDLGARDREIAQRRRDLAQETHGVEPRREHEAADNQHQAHRDRDAHDTHVPAMAKRAAESPHIPAAGRNAAGRNLIERRARGQAIHSANAV